MVARFYCKVIKSYKKNSEDMKPIIALSFLMLFVGCEISDFSNDQIHSIEAGNYSGIFIFREKGYVSQGKVKFSFTENSYTCIPETQYLPPRGGGKYKIKIERIHLTDLFPHTAEFDPSLILNGEFLIVRKNIMIILTQKDEKRNRERYIELTKSQCNDSSLAGFRMIGLK